MTEHVRSFSVNNLRHAHTDPQLFITDLPTTRLSDAAPFDLIYQVEQIPDKDHLGTFGSAYHVTMLLSRYLHLVEAPDS